MRDGGHAATRHPLARCAGRCEICYPGLSQSLEYTNGGDPRVEEPLPVTGTVDGWLANSFPRCTAVTGVARTLQGRDKLSNWTNLARSATPAPNLTRFRKGLRNWHKEYA